VVDSCDKYGTDILAYSPLQQGLLTGKFHVPSDVPEGRRRTKLFSSKSTDLSRHGQMGAEDQTFAAIDAIRAVCDATGEKMSSTALSWLIAQKRVASVIVGASKPEQMEENCRLFEIKAENMAKLNAATDKLKEHFGEDPDLWAKETRIR